MDERRSHTRQVVGSLLVAAAIVAIVIVAVTAKLGPTSVAEIEQREARIEAAEERREQLEEIVEERRED